jgi:hypothetical protein
MRYAQYLGVPRPDACRMNSDQNLARTGHWARHILEHDYLRASKHVDAIGFHCHSHECPLHEKWIESGALNKAGRELSGPSVYSLSQLCVVVCDEDRKEARRLRVTRICTNQVSTAGGLKEGLAGAIDPHWPSRGILRANLSGKYIGEDAAGMTVHR